MRKRYHLPTHINCRAEIGADEKARLQGAILGAVRQAIENSASEAPEITVTDFEVEANAGELFSSDRYQPERTTYSVPSYDQGGSATEVPVEAPPAAAEAGTTSEENTAWTPQRIADHIRQTFGTDLPSGQTHYGVQTREGLVFVDLVNGAPVLRSFTIGRYEKDVRSHWEPTGTESRYPRGRYTFRVTGEAGEGDHPFPNLGVVTDLQGRPIGRPIYTPLPVGFQIVFDVPEALQPEHGAGSVGSPAGSGILPGGTALVLFQCHPQWDTRPLSDPAYAGMSDDDLYRLFINLCNARAIENLDLSETYIREELAPRYTGPGGATNALSGYSRHNVQHFQEDLRLLRGLMLALNRLTEEISSIHADLDPLVITHRRTSGQFITPFGFNAPMSAQVFWPTYHPPSERDRPRVEELLGQLSEKGQASKTVMTGILLLVQRDPFLTQFVRGLELGSDFADARDRAAIEASLADVGSPEEVQRQILQKLDEILRSITRAREKLCHDPERILDVPLVYTQVQESLEGINPRFDQVARDRIARHQRLQAWTDIGLGAAGLVLFVGGLIVSVAGGPAGVIAFLEFSGTALGVVMALRSFDRADFLTALSDASVEYGRGLVTAEAARDARFWAAVDAALAVVDVGLAGIRAARSVVAARRTETLARLSRGAEEFAESVEVGRAVPFEELVNRAAPRGQLLLSEGELAQLQSLGRRAAQTAGRIAEEVAERTVSQSGEYVRLATKVGSNQGIDLLFLRRRIFEEVFGTLTNPRDAGRIFAQASEAQQQRLLRALRRSANAEDLVSMEVKFSRAGEPVEELLGTGRRAVQQNQQWYRSLLPAMRRADPEVQATGRLLEEIIGLGAQNLDRLSRVGISIDATGVFTLTRLNERIIALAHESRSLYRSRRYFGLIAGLREAERGGNAVRAQRLRALLQGINGQITTLDAAVRSARQAEVAARRAQQLLQRAAPALAEVEALRVAPQTPAVISALHVANATARGLVEAAKYAIEQADADYQRANQSNAEAVARQTEFEAAINAAIDEWERVEPGARERILLEGDRLRQLQSATPVP